MTALKNIITVALLVLTFSNEAQTIKNEKQDVLNPSFDMVFVKGGAFLMGTNDEKRNSDEKPSHTIEVDGFWIAKHEVSWEQYEAFMYATFDSNEFVSKEKLTNLGIDAVSGATPPYIDMSFNMGKINSPAVNMTQYAAIMYCKWLTAKSGVFYRLPTEAEWEYACKKGKTDDSATETVGWFSENSNDKYQKIAKKQPNTLGVYDMLGNVSEWTYDQYSTTFYENAATKNPINIPTELYPRVLRGGSWKDTSEKLCCTSRQASKQEWKQRDPQIPKSNWWLTDAPFVGFRVVRPQKQPHKSEIKKYWLDAIEDFGI